MINRYRVLVVMLLVATILWGIVFYQSSQEYHDYTKDYWEQCWIEMQRALEEDGLYIDFGLPPSYWDWNGGRYVLISGYVLLCAWIIVTPTVISGAKVALLNLLKKVRALF